MVRSKRLVTLDILRGFFLFVIIIDHVELYPSILDFFTGRGRLWVSAAEGFFFISGLLVGYIYRRKLQQGFAFVWKKLWQRAGLLYIWATIFTLGFTLWAVSSGHPGVKYGLPAVIDWPTIIWQTLTLQYSFGWADFLPHYVWFMLAAPAVLWALAKGKWWLVVAGSALLWLLRGDTFEWAWQVVFVGGMVTGYYWQWLQAFFANLAPLVRKRLVWSVTSLAAVTFLVSYASVYVLSELNNHRAELSPILSSFTQAWDSFNTAIWPAFEKWTLEPGRIVLFGLWFAAAYIWVDHFSALISRASFGFFELLGKHSLFVYGLHAVVIFGFQLLVPPQTSLLENFIFSTGVVAIIAGITACKAAVPAIVAWLKRRKPISQLVISKNEVE